MVLIISEYEDNSTVYVTKWLLSFNIPFLRIDQEEQYEVLETEVSNLATRIVLRSKLDNTKIIDSNKISSVWYRRGGLSIVFPSLGFITNKELKEHIQLHLEGEIFVLEDFFTKILEMKPHIGKFRRRVVNKLVVLNFAKKNGLTIPATYIFSQKKFLQSDKKKMITKSIYEGFRPRIKHNKYTTYTECIEKKDIPERFFPSLFQQRIDKEADLRVFYLKGKFYAMAIRSQDNEQTVTDFRKYLSGFKNRSFPFQLPQKIENQLHNLMKDLELETGSIDLILTESGDFIFLEVNPVGQFGMTSIPCNYYLEKEIALALIQNT